MKGDLLSVSKIREYKEQERYLPFSRESTAAPLSISERDTLAGMVSKFTGNIPMLSSFSCIIAVCWMNAVDG
jgi:hypothetical protein